MRGGGGIHSFTGAEVSMNSLCSLPRPPAGLPGLRWGAEKLTSFFGLLLGHTWGCSGLIPGAQGEHLGCWEPHVQRARQVPPCHLISPGAARGKTPTDGCKLWGEGGGSGAPQQGGALWGGQGAKPRGGGKGGEAQNGSRVCRAAGMQPARQVLAGCGASQARRPGSESAHAQCSPAWQRLEAGAEPR